MVKPFKSEDIIDVLVALLARVHSQSDERADAIADLEAEVAELGRAADYVERYEAAMKFDAERTKALEEKVRQLEESKVEIEERYKRILARNGLTPVGGRRRKKK